MKYLFILDYWVPFPDSEYGGLITLIAKDENEAFDILSNEEQLNVNSNHIHAIMEKLVTGQKLRLDGDYQSGILEAFVT